ncbi:hypothetical protein RD110_11040 [Rhodoferax koreense]|uniref:Phage tail protein n=1 Tax=Rhodoferax koreensis TaxID=1842727 RepID=A0A1P8JV89_9BURK|nr:hypothetical protein [Rhodoferax koreense]APW37662.1 hypothetical protein RD110_11040 [Rhodoferax koreense]
MAVQTTLASLSTNAALNGPDGASDPPSTLDDAIRYHGAFIATLRDQADAITNQTWQNLTASRAINTTYTNSTGRSIMVAASASGLVANSTLAVAWNIAGVSGIGINVATAGSTPANTTLTACALIPNGATYVFAVTQGSLTSWFELR